MSQDHFCGNCGHPRSPSDTICSHCGVPFAASGFDLATPTIDLQAPTQHALSSPQPIWQTPAPPYYPAPPASRLHWTMRLLIGQGVLVLILLAIIIVLLVRPSGGSTLPQQNVLATTTATATPSPTTQPTPPYVSNLSSTNMNLFVNALADALQEQDVASIEPHVDTVRFLIVCAQGNSIPGTCDTSWYDLKPQLENGSVLLDIPPDATLNQTPVICPDWPTGAFATPVAGTYTQSAGLPLSHIGTIDIGVTCVTCGSSSTWAWDALYFC
jgi:hypothetical protein